MAQGGRGRGLHATACRLRARRGPTSDKVLSGPGKSVSGLWQRHFPAGNVVPRGLRTSCARRPRPSAEHDVFISWAEMVLSGPAHPCFRARKDLRGTPATTSPAATRGAQKSANDISGAEDVLPEATRVDSGPMAQVPCQEMNMTCTERRNGEHDRFSDSGTTASRASAGHKNGRQRWGSAAGLSGLE